MAILNTATLESPPVQQKQNYTFAISIIGVLFFIFGFVTWTNGSLIPFLQLACELTVSQALLVTFAFYMAYFFLALPSSFILEKTGFKNGMSLGLFVMAIGSLIFIPAAMNRTYSLFLIGLFVQGTGLALLQTASNPYISVLGPIESAAKRISIMGIANKAAGAIAPLIVGALVLSGAQALKDKIAAADATVKEQLLNDLASKVIVPYALLAAVLIVLAVILRYLHLPEIEAAEDDSVATEKEKTSIFQYPHLWLGVICLFVYVGVEVMAGDVIGTYGKMLGFSLDDTKHFTSYTLISMVVGYVVGIVCIPKYMKQETALIISSIIGVIFTVGAYFTTGSTSVTFIALLGLANSLMWPAIFPMAINKLGKYTKIGSALLIMGIAGGAILPQIYAGMFDTKSMFSFLYSSSINFQLAFIICMLPCYAYILYYAIAGHKVGLAKK
ncbi:sugar MFS transporter [Solitalea koreensis]|nr:sugar MFS transporter [Solitalea koreensis]